VPFIYHQYSAYSLFCGGPHIASWCLKFPPSIYAHVQSTYWNVGLFRYWTLQQVPNFIISAPPLLSIFYFSFHYITRSRLLHSVSQSLTKSKDSPPTLPTSPFLSLSLAPHVLHALFLTTTLLFASHTQIILRLGPSMPLTYWAAAWLVVERPHWGRWWISWSVIWSAVSVVLWSSFLPPA
jgi:phosphatidylinositol glycan class V